MEVQTFTINGFEYDSRIAYDALISALEVMNNSYLSLAIELDSLLCDIFYQAHIGRATPDDWADRVVDFETYAKQKYPDLDFSQVLNFPLEKWYLGNVLNRVFTLMFQPYVMFNQNPFQDLRQHILPQPHIHALYRLMVFFITKHDVDLTLKDHFGSNSIEYLMQMAAWFSQGMPPFLRNYLFSCMWFLRNHTNHYKIIRGGLENLVARYKKRKWAVSKIEDQWLEYTLSPYTRKGLDKIRQLEKHFMSCL